MQISVTALVTIAGMAAVTYLTRVGGLLLMRRVAPSPRVQLALKNLPGALVVSILVPSVVAGGAPEAVATALTILVTGLTGNIFLGTALGVGAVWVLRKFA